MQHSPNLSDVDEIANAMLLDLLSNRRFQQHWAELVVNTLDSSQPHHMCSKTIGDAPLTGGSYYRGASGRPCTIGACATTWKIVQDSARELSNVVEIAVENFLNNAYFGFHPSDMPSTSSGQEMGRESATIYAIRVQLDRFFASPKFQPAQFGLLSRRLIRLMRSFIIALARSNTFRPFCIGVGASFAVSVCDMLYRLEEYTSLTLANDPTLCHCGEAVASAELRGLRRAADDFYANVVKPLEEEMSRFLRMQRHRRRASHDSRGQQPTRSVQQHEGRIKRSFSMGKIGGAIIVPNRPSTSMNKQYIARTNSRNDSFILPGKLVVERRKVVYGSPLTPVSRTQSVGNSRANTPNSTNNKVARKFGSCKMPNSKISSPSSLKLIDKETLRQTLEITRDCVEELAKKIDAI